MHHKALNQILDRHICIHLTWYLSSVLKKPVQSICKDICKGGSQFLLHTNGVPLSEFLFEHVLKKKTVPGRD